MEAIWRAVFWKSTLPLPHWNFLEKIYQIKLKIVSQLKPIKFLFTGIIHKSNS